MSLQTKRVITLSLLMLFSNIVLAECNFIEGGRPWTAVVNMPVDISIPIDSQVGDVIHSDQGWQQLGSTKLRCSTTGYTSTGYDFEIEESSIAGVYKIPGMPELGVRITYDNTHNNSELGNTIFHYPHQQSPHIATSFTPTGNFKVDIVLLSSLVNFRPDNYSVDWPGNIGSVRYSNLLVGTVIPSTPTMNITVTNDEYCYIISNINDVYFNNVSLEDMIASHSLATRKITVTCPYTSTNNNITHHIRFSGNAEGNQFVANQNGIKLRLQDDQGNIINPDGTVIVSLAKRDTGHTGEFNVHFFPVVDENKLPTSSELGEWALSLTLED